MNIFQFNDKTIDFCDKAGFFSFCALMFFAPISSALTETFTALPLVFFLVQRIRFFFLTRKKHRFPEKENVCVTFLKSFRVRRGPVLTGIWIWFGFVLLSAIGADHLNEFWRGLYGKVFPNIMIFILLIEFVRTKDRVKAMVLTLISSVSLVVAAGLWQKVFGWEFLRMSELAHGRVSSSLGEPTDCAAYFVLMLPVLAGFVWSFVSKKITAKRFCFVPERAAFLWLAVVSVLGFAVLGFTFTRAALLAMVVALGFQMVRDKKLAMIMIPSLIVFSLGTLWLIAAQREHLYWNNLFSLTGREVYWREAILMIYDHAINGVGLNGYSQQGLAYKWPTYGGWGGYPHNCYLHMAAEIGIAGAAVFALMLKDLLVGGYRRWKEMEDPFLKSLQIGLLSGFIGFLLHSAFDTFFYSTQLSALMWMFMGLIVAVPRVADDN